MKDRISRDREQNEKLIGERIITFLSLLQRLLGRRGAVGWLGCRRRSELTLHSHTNFEIIEMVRNGLTVLHSELKNISKS